MDAIPAPLTFGMHDNTAMTVVGDIALFAFIVLIHFTGVNYWKNKKVQKMCRTGLLKKYKDGDIRLDELTTEIAERLKLERPGQPDYTHTRNLTYVWSSDVQRRSMPTLFTRVPRGGTYGARFDLRQRPTKI